MKIVALVAFFISATAVFAVEQNKSVTVAGNSVGGEFVDVDNTEGIIFSVDTQPEFIGGKDSLYSFLVKNINLISVTDVCVERLYVDFWVNPDSTVVHVCVVQPALEVMSALEAEVVRVVTLTSGHWKPATKKGKPVAQKVRLPVIFTPGRDK